MTKMVSANIQRRNGRSAVWVWVRKDEDVEEYKKKNQPEVLQIQGLEKLQKNVPQRSKAITM